MSQVAPEPVKPPAHQHVEPSAFSVRDKCIQGRASVLGSTYSTIHVLPDRPAACFGVLPQLLKLVLRLLIKRRNPRVNGCSRFAIASCAASTTFAGERQLFLPVQGQQRKSRPPPGETRLRRAGWWPDPNEAAPERRQARRRPQKTRRHWCQWYGDLSWAPRSSSCLRRRIGVTAALRTLGAVAGDVELEQYGVVHEAIDGRRRRHLIAKDAVPLPEDEIAGQQN